MNADGSGLRVVVPGGGLPSWSINDRIALSKDGSIWTVNPDGSGLLRVTSVGAGEEDAFPKWSRDGSKLVFLHIVPSAGSLIGRDYDVVTIRADGTDRRTLVTKTYNMNPSWSPDGAYVLYEQQELNEDPMGSRCFLYKIPASGGPSVNLTPNRGVGYCGGASWRPM